MFVLSVILLHFKSAVCVSDVTCIYVARLQMPSCASTVCKYVVQYPEAPSPGTYTISAIVNFQSEGAAALASTSSSAAVQVHYNHLQMDESGLELGTWSYPFVHACMCSSYACQLKIP